MLFFKCSIKGVMHLKVVYTNTPKNDSPMTNIIRIEDITDSYLSIRAAGGIEKIFGDEITPDKTREIIHKEIKLKNKDYITEELKQFERKIIPIKQKEEVTLSDIEKDVSSESYNDSSVGKENQKVMTMQGVRPSVSDFSQIDLAA